jgi:hypothetical protein
MQVINIDKFKGAQIGALILKDFKSLINTRDV